MSAQIVIDLQKITDLNCGLGQFSWHLARELLKISSDIGFYLPQSSWMQFPGHQNLIEQKKWHRLCSFFSPSAEVFHSLHQEAPYWPRSRKSKYVLTIHDLNILLDEDKSLARQEKWLKEVQKRVDRAQAVTFISEYSQNIAHEHLNFSGQIEKVIYNGVPLRKDLSAEKPQGALDSPFLFAVATVLKKKNFHTLIAMMQELPKHRFVLAGWKDNPYAREMESEIRRLGLQERFVLIGKVSEAEKNWLYQNAMGLVFPSLQEGFGLPVVEAMSFGLPVFLSRHCALPEIGGDLAFYFDDFSPEHMASVVQEGLAKYEKDPSLRDRLTRRGGFFSWENAARQYYSLYQELLSH